MVVVVDQLRTLEDRNQPFIAAVNISDRDDTIALKRRRGRGGCRAEDKRQKEHFSDA
jgi:hypothetical protein